MIKTWLRLGGMAALAAAAFGLGRSADADTVIFSNNYAPGDSVTTGGTHLIDGTGWRYQNVSAGGEVGIRTNIPDDNGNGSVYFKSANEGHNPSGRGKADLHYTQGTSKADALGQLKDLTALAYDWYRDAASTSGGSQTVALKLSITNFGSPFAQKGELVFEPYYTTGSVLDQSDEWITEDIWANKDTANMWISDDSFFLTSIPAPPANLKYKTTLADYLDESNSFYLGDFWVTGITIGIGSGWANNFEGAADNVTFGFKGGEITTYNFEVQGAAVPEPGGIVMGLIAGGLGLAGAAWRRRRAG